MTITSRYRNRVEFKAITHQRKILLDIRRYRNRVEFKVRIVSQYDLRQYGRYRNRVEFKVKSVTCGVLRLMVDIETEWNLKGVHIQAA